MKYQNPKIESSYQENDIGRDLYNAVLFNKPKKIIEFGSLYGYSTIAMAMALHELGEGKIVVYDLFDKYAFKHSTKSKTQENVDKYGLTNFVELKEMDFDEWAKNPEKFDMMHFDISNNGDKIAKLYAIVKDQIDTGSQVYFEGGIKERDEISWMVKYGFKKINDSGIPFTVINEKFPSLSLIKN
jgi:predicted O-methyltransferase YrrM